jgi:hypothetical protein
MPRFSLGTLDPAVFRFGIHQYNIRPDAPDAVPGDYKIIPAASESHQPAGTGDHNSAYFSFRYFHDHIRDKAKSLAIAEADHFLALKIRKFAAHIRSSRCDFGSWYAAGKGDMTMQEMIISFRIHLHIYAWSE